jgi:HD-GYP domain-containing protein (c-di-GMP phosphodiesterase class II)
LRHHERPDGRGYPLGETTIPAEANVVAAADALHTICSNRSYHRHQKLDFALEKIREGKGTQFLPEIVTAVERTYGDMANFLTDLTAE